MSKKEIELPTRFSPRSDQPDEFRHSRMFRYMKSSEFRKSYNKIVNPYLRKAGFKATGFIATKEDEQFYYMVYWGSGKSGGEGNMIIVIHPKGLPTKHEFQWEEKNVRQVHQYLFGKDISLPNGNIWIDTGINTEEAEETCQYLLRGLDNTLEEYLASFSQYPENLLKINVDNFYQEYLFIYENLSLNFSFKPVYEAAIWLARIHAVNNSDCTGLADIAKEELTKRVRSIDREPDEDSFVHIEAIKQGKLFR